MPATCKYWQSSTCRNGNSCRFDHPNGRNSSRDTGSTFGGNNNRQGGFGGSGTFGGGGRPDRWNLNSDDVRSDLTLTRPKWILSSYGPGKDAPASLFFDNEFSPEEVRMRFIEAQATGKADEADREAINVWQKADLAMQEAVNNLSQIPQFLEDKEKQHPNRYDFTDSLKFDGTINPDQFKRDSQVNSQPTPSTNPFGSSAAPATTSTPFSKPTFGDAAKPNPFSQPAKSTFGQPSQPSAFGQPAQASSFGQPSQPSGFGKPAFGQSTSASPFGQPAQTSAFGQPAFGKPAQTSSFGQPAQTSAFGQSSQPSAFGKPAFGQSSFGQTTQQPAFGQSPFAAKPSFGQPTSVAPPTSSSSNASAFGQSAFSSQNNTNNTSAASASTGGAFAGYRGGFGSNPAPSSGFAAVGRPAGFGTTPSPFGQNSSSSNPQSTFGQPLNSQSTQSPFGQRPTTDSTPTLFGSTVITRDGSAQGSPFGPPASMVANDNASMGGLSMAQSASTAPSQVQGFGPNPFGKDPNAASAPALPTAMQSGNQAPPSSVPNSIPGSFGKNPVPSEARQDTTRANKVGADLAIPGNRAPIVFAQSLPNYHSQTAASGDLVSYKGLPVHYEVKKKPTIDGEEVVDQRFPVLEHPQGQGYERIWFVNGADEGEVQKLAAKLYDIEEKPDRYTDDIKDQYSRLLQTGRFDGRIPEVPPLHSWVDYDF